MAPKASGIPLEFELTAEDFNESLRLQMKHSPIRKLIRASSYLLVFSTALVLCLWCSGDMNLSSYEFGIHGFLVVAAITGGFFGIWNSKRNFVASVKGKPIFYRFTDHFLFWSSPDGEGKLKMNIFNGWYRGESIYLLSQPPHVTYIVPRRAIPQDRVEELEQILTRTIGQPK